MAKIDPAGLRESRLYTEANKLFTVDEFAYRAVTSTNASGRSLLSLARHSERGLQTAIQHLKEWTPE